MDGDYLLLLPEQYLSMVSDPQVAGPEEGRALAHSVLVWDALSAACLSPANRVDGREMFPKLCQKAAILAWRLLDLGLPAERWKAHAAWLALLEFVEQNGGDPWSDRDDLAAQAAASYMDLAMDRRVSFEDFTIWLCSQMEQA
jgi:hypothetical protein